MKKIALSLALSLLFTLPLSAGEGLPKGWGAKETRHFTGHDLYGHIDGGAEIFLEFGFERLTVTRYRKGKKEIAVETYMMKSPRAALGIYLFKCGRETPLAEIPTRNSSDAYQVTAVKGDLFLQVNNVSGDPKLLPVMTQLARNAFSAIPVTKPDDLFSLLPEESLVRDSVRLFAGPYGLQKIYTFGEGDIFSQRGEIFGVAGEYGKGKNGTWTRIVIAYSDTRRAERAFRYAVTHLDAYLKIVRKSPAHVVFKDWENKYGDITLNDKVITSRVGLPDQSAFSQGRS